MIRIGASDNNNSWFRRECSADGRNLVIAPVLRSMLLLITTGNADIPDGIIQRKLRVPVHSMDNAPIAIVTGAGGGIGREISIALAAHQWTVVVNDLDAAEAGQTLQLINDAGGKAVVLDGDIGDWPTVEQIFSSALQTCGTPTLLVNNAGVQTWASLADLSPEQWSNTLNTNLTGCFLMTKCFATTAPAGSSIINIGSGCNKLAFPKLIDYTAAKGGIEMFTKSSALDLGPQGVRVNCIAPGAIATDRTAAETDDYNDRWAALTPLQRIGTPQDIANAVLLLADDRAGFITGQTINVDGGLFSRAIWPDSY